MGTRPVADSGVMLSPNHPHACGDKTLSSKSLKDCWGSSPRVWGQDGADRQERQEDRIIPTRVGTSIDDCAFSGCTGDHPHACGDKLSPLDHLHSSSGSSPRVWGQDVSFSINSPSFRIIPTRVGTSALAPSPPAAVGDHPHACGDKLSP